MHNSNNEKGGRLFDGSLTDEVIESSESVLQNYRGSTKGLQQFFSPPEISQLLADLFGNVPILDLTAGNGALLKAFPPAYRFGIEIDKDQIQDAEYHSIHADIQKVFPLLKLSGIEFPLIALNPPFGLTWKSNRSDKENQKINSTALTFLYSLDLLKSVEGHGLLIAGSNRFYEKIYPEYKEHFYYILEVPDLFTNAEIKSVVALYIPAEIKLSDFEPQIVSTTTSEIPTFADDIQAFQKQHYVLRTPYFYGERFITPVQEKFAIIQREYDKRFRKDKKKSKYSISLSGKKIKVSLSAFQTLALNQKGVSGEVKSLNNQSLNMLLLNPQDRHMIERLENENYITVEPTFRNRLEELVSDVKKKKCPMYEVKPQQRLGFLTDVTKIKCKKDDDLNTENNQNEPFHGFKAGIEYPVKTRSVIQEEEFIEEKVDSKGNLNEVRKKTERKILRITIGESPNEKVLNESKEDIEYLIEHFELPNPSNVKDRFPKEFKNALDTVKAIEKEYGQELGWSYMDFQRDDLTRLIMKGRGLLTWEQGLGKSLAGLTFAQAMAYRGAQDAALFIVPQDLLKQWRAEAKKFFDRELTLIKNIPQARQIAKYLNEGGEGWFITYFEALSRNSREFELQEFKLRKKLIEQQSWNRDKLEMETTTEVQSLYDKDFCPICSEPADGGAWDPKRGICEGTLKTEIDRDYYPANDDAPKYRIEKCNHVHRKRQVKALYFQLTTAFKRGTIIFDEIAKIKGQYTLISKSVRALRAHHKLGLSGSPVKNLIPDLFWPMWWSLGDSTPQFPYSYDGGYRKFANMFTVTEYTLDDQGRKVRSKTLPEVTNLSVLWKLLCSSLIHRRKENTNEDLVGLTYHPITVPWGKSQRKFYKKWLNKSNFVDFFCTTHPDSNIANFPNAVAQKAAILGQLWKLEQMTTLPESEPDMWFEIPNETNWTPANLKVLELAEKFANQGKKILIGSDLKAFGPFISKQLKKKGFNVVDITRETSTGKLKTIAPRKRSKLIDRFKNNGIPVLCASVSALMLGHNLDCVEVVILRGLPWAHSSLKQYISRAHRLTSENPVDIYIVMTQNSLDFKKWELLEDKTAAAELALDGQLVGKDEVAINMQEILEELQDRGLPSSDQAVPEPKLKSEFFSDSKFDKVEIGGRPTLEELREKVKNQKNKRKRRRTKVSSTTRPSLF